MKNYLMEEEIIKEKKCDTIQHDILTLLEHFHTCEVCQEVIKAKASDEKVKDVIRQVADLLSQTRYTFRSRQIEQARKLLETLL